MGGMPWLF